MNRFFKAGLISLAAGLTFAANVSAQEITGAGAP